MFKFLIYLFESGLCLSILFLVYIFFFRKETFFHFNRIYLIAIILFSLSIPFLHISIHVNNIEKYENSFNDIGRFRSYYEQVIALTDPEYIHASSKQNASIFENDNPLDYTNASINSSLKPDEISDASSNSETFLPVRRKISNASIFLIIYLIGVAFFLSRIIYLLFWIYKTARQNSIEHRANFKLITVNKNLPPFSFLNLVFINDQLMMNNKSDQIIAHECIHINQKHSIDLLLAHALTIFQWINPFVWFLQKAIKTNHEYIADHVVVKKGFDLLNYQELLLNQFLNIRSVELVNNFNLISIKKRIAMMNKIKSGFLAKLKALLIIPAAVITFFLFANLTVNGPGKVLKNFSFFESQNNNKQVLGLWKNNSENAYGYLIQFDMNKVSILENKVFLKEYEYSIKDNKIIISIPNSEPIELKFQLSENKIKIWWNDLNSSVYTKTNFKNSMDVYLADKNINIKPPVVKNYKILERLELCIFVAIQENKVIVQNQVGKLIDLEKLIIEEKSKFNQLDLNRVTVHLAIDKGTPMKEVYGIYQTFRKNGLYKISVACYPDESSNKLLPPTTAFTHKLPPLDAEMINSKELEAKSINHFKIDANMKGGSVAKVKTELTQFVSNSDKYYMSLIYSNKTIFGEYVAYMDMVWTVILDFRNQYSLEKYKIDYENLGKELQLEVKKRYPIILTQVNIDEDKKN